MFSSRSGFAGDLDSFAVRLFAGPRGREEGALLRRAGLRNADAVRPVAAPVGDRHVQAVLGTAVLVRAARGARVALVARQRVAGAVDLEAVTGIVIRRVGVEPGVRSAGGGVEAVLAVALRGAALDRVAGAAEVESMPGIGGRGVGVEQAGPSEDVEASLSVALRGAALDRVAAAVEREPVTGIAGRGVGVEPVGPSRGR